MSEKRYKKSRSVMSGCPVEFCGICFSVAVALLVTVRDRFSNASRQAFLPLPRCKAQASCSEAY